MLWSSRMMQMMHKESATPLFWKFQWHGLWKKVVFKKKQAFNFCAFVCAPCRVQCWRCCRKNPMSKCWNVDRPSHLELVLLPGVALAPDVLLQVHVVFERLSGGREGNRGQKLNHQTTKHTHGKREGEKGKEKEEKEGRGKQSFRFFIPREWKTKND